MSIHAAHAPLVVLRSIPHQPRCTAAAERTQWRDSRLNDRTRGVTSLASTHGHRDHVALKVSFGAKQAGVRPSQPSISNTPPYFCQTYDLPLLKPRPRGSGSKSAKRYMSNFIPQINYTQSGSLHRKGLDSYIPIQRSTIAGYV
jgi:hypothetical protein